MKHYIDTKRHKLCALEDDVKAPAHYTPATSERPSQYHRPVVTDGKHAGWQVPDLTQAKADQMARINAEHARRVGDLLAAYPDAERQTFPMQRTEAGAYLAWLDSGVDEPAPETPCLSAILEGRNGPDGAETLEDLARSVVANSDALAAAQKATGTRHRLAKQIGKAQTFEDVAAVVWPE